MLPITELVFGICPSGSTVTNSSWAYAFVYNACIVSVVATLVNFAVTVLSIPRGIGALGYTIQRPTEERYLMTRAELESRLPFLADYRAEAMRLAGTAQVPAAADWNVTTL